MAKRIAIIGGIIVGVLAIAALAGVLYLRTYFSADGAKSVASVVGEAGAKRVLGVFAHPDDEQLVTGFFSYAKEKDGAFTSLVTGTKGEAGHQVPTVARQQDLGIVRKAEALKNGFALGIDDQEVWDYPDGDVPEVPMEELVARVVAKIVAVQPELVVTFWPASGATGHKDHMRMGLVAETAVKQVRAQANGDYRGPKWIAYVITPPNGLRSFAERRASSWRITSRMRRTPCRATLRRRCGDGRSTPRRRTMCRRPTAFLTGCSTCCGTRSSIGWWI